jgi:hypothetical protein
MTWRSTGRWIRSSPRSVLADHAAPWRLPTPTLCPHSLFATGRGEILDYGNLAMAGSAAGLFYKPQLEDLIELPPGSELFTLPGRLPVGIEPETGEPALLDANPYNPGESIQAVAAFMAPAHTAILTAAYENHGAKAALLPLFAYTAVGWGEGKFWVAGFRSDADCRQDADRFNQRPWRNAPKNSSNSMAKTD